MNHTELDQYLEIIKVCLIESATKINKWREKIMLEVLLFFVNGAIQMGFHVISRLRDDASLRYLTTQLPVVGLKNTMVRLT